MHEPATTLGALGELEVLARITARLPAADAALVGPGDDCAVLQTPDGRSVVTTDMMVHGPDFRWAWSSPTDLGWKAAATNLSDVAAMGARPTALLVAIAAPADTDVTVLEGIADGLAAACAALAPGCGVVGGDLSTSATFTIAVTAFGDLAGRAPVLRSGARPGDLVAVSGTLGRAGAGLAHLFRSGVDASGRPDPDAVAAFLADADEDARDAVARQRRPLPPIADGVLAARAGATAMLDLSDGLAIDGGRLARASGVVLDLDPAVVTPGVALHGGEDHGLLATFPPGSPPAGATASDGAMPAGAAPALPGGFRVIGTVRAVAGPATGRPGAGRPGVLLGGAPVPTTGWDPYADWDGSGG